MASKKGKEVVGAPQFSNKRGYVSWNSEMDSILISVLYEQINQGNKANGDWKTRAYQAVAQELNSKMGMDLNWDQIRNRVRLWKKHHATVSEIRQKIKFYWDESRCQFVIGKEDVTDWIEYCEVILEAKPYKNKPIENWDDICILVEKDRATVNEAEQIDESAAAMEAEFDVDSLAKKKPASSSSNKKLKRDRLADALFSVAETLKQYVDSKSNTQTRPTNQEILTVVSSVPGIARYQILRAVKKFMNAPGEFSYSSIYQRMIN